MLVVLLVCGLQCHLFSTASSRSMRVQLTETVERAADDVSPKAPDIYIRACLLLHSISKPATETTTCFALEQG